MEYVVYLPRGRESEFVCQWGEYLNDLEGAMSLRRKFPRRVMQSKIRGFKPYLISDFPGYEVACGSRCHEFPGRVVGGKSFFSSFVESR